MSQDSLNCHLIVIEIFVKLLSAYMFMYVRGERFVKSVKNKMYITTYIWTLTTFYKQPDEDQ